MVITTYSALSYAYYPQALRPICSPPTQPPETVAISLCLPTYALHTPYTATLNISDLCTHMHYIQNAPPNCAVHSSLSAVQLPSISQDCDNTNCSIALATASWSLVSSKTTSAAALAGAPALATAMPSPANCTANNTHDAHAV